MILFIHQIKVENRFFCDRQFSPERENLDFLFFFYFKKKCDSRDADIRAVLTYTDNFEKWNSLGEIKICVGVLHSE